MKKIVSVVVLSVLAFVASAQNRPLVKPGDAGLKREAPPADLVAPHPDRPLPPVFAPWTPFALNVCSLSFPSAPGLEVDGLRLNVTVPFATPDHRDVYGLDLGFAGEAAGHVGGIAINALDNWSSSFAGGAVALVNVADELRGVQIGLVNVAKEGAGLQIGLWNASSKYAGPFVGATW